MDNYTPEITEIEVVGKHSISILDSCSIDEIGVRFKAHYSELSDFAKANNLNISGFPRAIYHTWEPPTKVVFEPLYVFDQPAPTVKGSRIISATTYSGKVITATHLGSYESSYRVWEGLDKYMNEHNLEPNGSPWEQYENTPRTEPDPNKLITHIFMPVK
jgi:effector-binding domain-containing protein